MRVHTDFVGPPTYSHTSPLFNVASQGPTTDPCLSSDSLGDKANEWLL